MHEGPLCQRPCIRTLYLGSHVRPSWVPLNVWKTRVRIHQSVRSPYKSPARSPPICGPHFTFYQKMDWNCLSTSRGGQKNGRLVDCSQRRRRLFPRLTAPTFFFSGDSRPPPGNPTSSLRLLPFLVWGEVASFAPVMACPFLEEYGDFLFFEWLDNFFFFFKGRSFWCSFFLLVLMCFLFCLLMNWLNETVKVTCAVDVI